MSEDNGLSEKPIDEGKDGLESAYKERGSQTLSYNEYMALRKQRKAREKAGTPAIVRILLMSPIIILFCIGLIFIPYMIYLYTTSEQTLETGTKK